MDEDELEKRLSASEFGVRLSGLGFIFTEWMLSERIVLLATNGSSGC